MNYFAHGFRFVEKPYFLAGTAVPDWLRVSDKAVRVRSKAARPWCAFEEGPVAEVAGGIVQHHQDDAWFHDSPAFLELTWKFTLGLRERLIPDEGFRPSFVGHVLVEVLLDGLLIAQHPELAAAYYAALESLDPPTVAAAVNRMAPRPAVRLAELIPRFCQERFLLDYNEDPRLLFRMNMVMRRVGLPPLPEKLQAWFPAARQAVRERLAELTAGFA